MTESIPTFYVFHGEDEFTLSETLDDFKSRLGPPDTVDLNTAVLDGKGLNLGKLRHVCDAVPFLADKRLVIVEGLLSRLGPRQGGSATKPDGTAQPSRPANARQALLDDLITYLPHLPDTTRLVFVENRSLPRNHPIVKLAKESRQGYVKRFDPPRAEALPEWIRRRVQMFGGDITPRASHRLAALVGANLRLLDQEINKLVTYRHGDGKITEAHVDALVPYAQDAVIFDLVDALGHRDGSTAADTLHRLLEEGEHPLGLLAMIIRQFRLLIEVKTLKTDGASPRDISKTLGIHPFPARKLHRQAVHFTPTQLEKVYRHLSDTDLAIKTGEIDAAVSLDLLVAGLAVEDL